ncbi:MAG TPA: hypothetical protein VN132_06230, partial [Bdellovibrio sp.]|nr:hypothetical protein [Bdellovibrio sp.]
MLKKLFFSSMVIVGLSNTALAAARFNAGACISQGNWLQAALQQSDVVANAINTLRNDPDCKVIIDALANSPKVERQSNDDEETNSFANMYQELSAINDYLKPERLGKSIALPGASAQKFREVVFQLVFNKSYDSIRQVQGDNFGSLAPRVEEIKRVSLNLKSFLDKSKKIANMTMATSKNLLAAIPQSKMCLHNKPSEAAAIFGAIAHSAAALTTGGQVNGVGEFISALLQFNRDMSYIKVLQPLEMARFQASVSCLIESTSESYCSTVDAEETLDYYKDINLSDIQKQRLQEVVENKGKDNVANPLGGLIILMRDVPILSSWMQKVLFGINPKISAEGKMKNEQWGAYLGFLQSLNSLQANFNELESLYYRDTDTKSNAGKLGQVRSILNKMVGIMIGGSGYDPDGGGSTQINFFLRTFQSAEAVPFILLGMSQPPATFNTRTNDFDQHWTSWANTGANGFNDPDALLRKIKEQVWITMEGAQREANNYFAARM